MDYEILATSAVQTSISKTARLSSYINSGDKEPSWDGNIYLHEDEKKTKHNIYKIPVQVKGKGVSKWNKQRITYPVSVTDLENYLHDGGTIFFVVYIDKKTGDAKQIFYSILLPKKVDDLLKNTTGKSTSIVLYPFPDDEIGKVNVFLFFKSHKEKQAVMLGQPNFDVKELAKKGMIDKMSFTFSAIGLTEEKIPQIMVNQKEFYLYANIKGTELSFPFEYVQDISYAVVEKVVENPVRINGIQYYDSYKVIYSSKGNMFKFGESTVMRFERIVNDSEQDMVQSSIKVKICGDLRVRTNDLEFALSMIDFQKIEIAGVEIPTHVSEDEKKKFGYEKQKENLVFLKKCCRVLEELKIKKDLNIDECSEEDYRNLMRLYQCIVEGKTVRGINPKLPIVNKIKLSNLNLLIVVLKDKKQKDCFRLLNFFDSTIPVEYAHEEGGEGFPTSQYCILKSEDILNIDNINYASIVNDFMNIELSDGMVTHANNVLLEMITAFDICKDENLYVEMLKFAEWLANLEEIYIYKEISQINKLQIIRRKRKLVFAEREILHEIVRRNENEQWSIGALLLLDEFEEAKQRFEALTEQEQEQFKAFPIGKFLIEEMI